MAKPRDLTGMKIGRLTVIERSGHRAGVPAWKCLCDCGKEKIVSSSGLMRKTKPIRSCGCLRQKRIDRTGQRFGKLTVVELDHIDKFVFWKCRCDCGNTSIVASNNLVTGNSTSCGCTKSAPARRNAVVRKYRKNAKESNREFSLSDEDIDELFGSPCFYCGRPPSNLGYKSKNPYNFVYSGIDRVNSSVGYTRENSVPCCKWCNIAKRERSVREFYEWARALCNNMKSWKPV